MYISGPDEDGYRKELTGKGCQYVVVVGVAIAGLILFYRWMFGPLEREDWIFIWLLLGVLTLILSLGDWKDHAVKMTEKEKEMFTVFRVLLLLVLHITLWPIWLLMIAASKESNGGSGW